MPRLSRFPSVFADIIIHTSTLRAPIQLVANTNKFLREEMQHRLGDLKRQVRHHLSTGEDLRGSSGSYTETPSSWNMSLEKAYYVLVKSGIPRYAGDKQSH